MDIALKLKTNANNNGDTAKYINCNMNDYREDPIELEVKEGIGKDEITKRLDGGWKWGRILENRVDMIIVI